MNVFGIGLPELAVLAAIGLLVFGPKRLPELGRTLGRTLKGFQSASSEFEREFRTAIATAELASDDPPPLPQGVSQEPQPSAVEAIDPLPSGTVPASAGTAPAPDTAEDPPAG